MARIDRSMSGLENREKTSVAEIMGAEMETLNCKALTLRICSVESVEPLLIGAWGNVGR